MQNTKAADVRHRPQLAYSLRSPRSDRNENGKQKKKKTIHLTVARTSDPSSQLCLGLLVFLRSQTCHDELGELTRQ